MKNKTSLIVCAIMAATLFATSCTADMIEEESQMHVSQMKSDIEKLASEYGLNVIFNDFPATRSDFSMEDIEEEFKMMSSLLGNYEIMGKQEGDSIVLSGLGSDLFSAGVMATPSIESGDKELSVIQHEYYHSSTLGSVDVCFEIIINLSWDFSIHNKVEIKDAVIHELNYGGTMNPSVSNKHVTVLGGVPIISFSCNLNLTGLFGSYYYSVSGDYNPATGVGSLSVI